MLLKSYLKNCLTAHCLFFCPSLSPQKAINLNYRTLRNGLNPALYPTGPDSTLAVGIFCLQSPRPMCEGRGQNTPSPVILPQTYRKEEKTQGETSLHLRQGLARSHSDPSVSTANPALPCLPPGLLTCKVQPKVEWLL